MCKRQATPSYRPCSVQGKALVKRSVGAAELGYDGDLHGDPHPHLDGDSQVDLKGIFTAGLKWREVVGLLGLGLGFWDHGFLVMMPPAAVGTRSWRGVGGYGLGFWRLVRADSS